MNITRISALAFVLMAVASAQDITRPTAATPCPATGGGTNCALTKGADGAILGTDISTPVNPAAGTTKLYPKGGKWCSLSPAGVESCGAGSVTSVGLAGTANQITVTGASPITGSGSWTLSLPTGLVLPSIGGQIVSTFVSTASTPAMFLTGTIQTGGTGTTNLPHVLIQPSTATASTTWNTSGTAFGINAHTGIGLLVDVQLDGTTVFKIGPTGVTNVLAGLNLTGDLSMGSSAHVNFGSNSILNSPVNGNVLMVNHLATDFGLLQFGGTAASFPALKRSATSLAVRLADDSGDGGLTTGTFTIITSSSPASGAACTAGAHTWDASFGYICTASGAWKRFALTGGY